MATNIRLRDIPKPEVKSVSPDDKIRKAYALMDEFNVDQVPILDDGMALLGVVTRRRLVLIRGDWGEMRVCDKEWPSPDPEELLRSSDASLDDVFDYLFDNDFVLISEDGKQITHILTINDVAKFLYKQQSSSFLSLLLRRLLALRRTTASSGG
ncbi:MAG: CBS domain-containing protein [Acidimicrobiia bacterium]|nr:CBS domain-containing protein [Acidimicrobiia bacterium]MCY4435509.1 CBS domain-containing protein [bacterium]